MKPTYLYVKQHEETGLKYFGKTQRKDPFKYQGSGLYWKKHIEKYGNKIKTLWVQRFDNIEELTKTALEFSMKNNIVESNEWANLKIENGLDGGSKPGKVSWNKGVTNVDASLRMKNNNPMFNIEIKSKHKQSINTPEALEKKSRAKVGNTNTKGKFWYNNGVDTRMFQEAPEGWVRGRINPHWNTNRNKDEKKRQSI